MSLKIINVFRDRIEEFKGDCDAAGTGMRGTGQIRWAFSSTATGEKPGKFDFDGLHTLFDRTEAEEIYSQAIENSPDSTKQELAVATVQSDVLSGMERDMLLRRRSRIRRLAHEAQARAHTGSENGVLELGLMYYLQNELQRVQEEPG